MKIVTWNINSVRLRMPLVERFIQERAPDVLCLQEIKCREAEFPKATFDRLGYIHQAVHAQKGYHGVAILSRHPLSDIDRRSFCAKADARHVAGTVSPSNGAGPIRIHNLYIPAGGDVPDREANEKFAHKLDFLDELNDVAQREAWGAGRCVLLGDLNVAPLECDVWNHKGLLSVVSHTPAETSRLQEILRVGRWRDAIRAKAPAPEKVFTWWSYRSPDWRAANKGRRLDHVWLGEGLASELGDAAIDIDARGWERPSDHVPVIVEIGT